MLIIRTIKSNPLHDQFLLSCACAQAASKVNYTLQQRTRSYQATKTQSNLLNRTYCDVTMGEWRYYDDTQLDINLVSLFNLKPMCKRWFFNLAIMNPFFITMERCSDIIIWFLIPFFSSSFRQHHRGLSWPWRHDFHLKLHSVTSLLLKLNIQGVIQFS